MRRRVVITGIGTVSGFGVGAEPLWEGLVSGRSALKRMSLFDPTGFRSKIAAVAAGFGGAKDYVPKSYRKAVKVMARDTELAVAAAKMAVDDARIQTRGTLPEGSEATTYPAARMGCHIGAGLIAAETDELTMALDTARAGTAERPSVNLRAWGSGPGGESAVNSLPPLWLLKYLPNMLACHVTIIHGAEGPSNTITCSEASGLLCVGESLRIIQRGAADLCFSGGAESKLNFMGTMRMDLAGRLAPTGDEGSGEKYVRPYDPEGTGGLLGEGGGILIMEDRDMALKRGARIRAEVIGFGSAHSDVMADLAGTAVADWNGADEGIQYSIENALEDAKVTPAQINAIVPHATGIPYPDSGELGALRAVFGARLKDVPMVTLPPAIGDTMAGSGAIAAAVGALCLDKQALPARIHAGKPHPDALAGAAPSRAARLRHTLVLTGSMGGQNAAVVLRATDTPGGTN
jgi:3-oxoacyl-[acyl-carrier-protein] synthase II